MSDPNDDQRVYEWLLHETYDALGNHTLCEYAADDPSLWDDDNPDLRLPEIFERRRRPTNRYLRRVYYGNLPEPLVDSQQHTVTYADGAAVGHLRGGRHYAFEVVFDYGDWPTPTVLPHPEPPADQLELFGADQPPSTTSRPVPLRADRFSHFARRLRDPNPSSLPSRLDVPSLRRAGRADAGALHRLHVRHRRGHRDVVAGRSDGHRLRQGCRRRVSIGQHAPGRLCLLALRAPPAALPIAHGTRRRPADTGPERPGHGAGRLVRRRSARRSAHRPGRVPLLAQPRPRHAGSAADAARRSRLASRSTSRASASGTWRATAWRTCSSTSARSPVSSKRRSRVPGNGSPRTRRLPVSIRRTQPSGWST